MNRHGPLELARPLHQVVIEGAQRPRGPLAAGQSMGRGALTPDGRTLVTEIREVSSDVWLVLNFDPDIE